MTQAQRLLSILRASSLWAGLLDRSADVTLAAWAVGAGALAQTVWNHLHGFPERHGLKDVDITYFDGDDLSEDAESRVIGEMERLFGGLGVALDVKNQARVHLWYERHFGAPIQPYRSLDDAIATWPTTATAVAIAPAADGTVRVIAPFGLGDLLAGIVRPNKRQIGEEIYRRKVDRWRAVWPRLDIRAWNDA